MDPSLLRSATDAESLGTAVGFLGHSGPARYAPERAHSRCLHVAYAGPFRGEDGRVRKVFHDVMLATNSANGNHDDDVMTMSRTRRYCSFSSVYEAPCVWLCGLPK